MGRPRQILAAGLLLVAAGLAGPAQAGDRPSRSRGGVTPAAAWSYAIAHEQNIVGEMDVATTKKLLPGTVPVLSYFDLHFNEGDHEMRRIGVLAKPQVTTLSFADQNSDDAFEGGAAWAVLPDGTTGKVSAVGGGVFEIPIPGGKVANHALLLTGFEFRRQDETDANVRAIGVWLDGKKAVARVSLVDDQGPDFAPFINALGKAIMNLSTLGMYAVATSHGEAVKKLNGGNNIDGFRPYAVTVQYAWVPNAQIEELGVFTGTGNKPSSGMKLAGDLGLTGFEFAFTNGDHHLAKLAVKPALTSLGGLQLGSGEIAFQDQNTDDPKKWAVGFARLKKSK